MNPLVSICIPTYQQTDYLRKTLLSVQEQTFQDYELLITDDSSDNRVELLLRDFYFGKRLTYIRNPKRKGSPSNWNNAIAMARGKYIKLLHHDDWFSTKDSLNKYVMLLEDHPDCHFAFSATNVWNDNNVRLYQAAEEELRRLKMNPAYLFVKNMVGAPSAIIFANFQKIKFDENLLWLPDVDFYISYLSFYKDFVYQSEPLICTTDGADHQVTRHIISDKDVQVFEHVYVFSRHCSSKPEQAALSVLRNLFIKYKINQMSQVDSLMRNLPYDRKTVKKILSQLYSKRFWSLLSGFLNRWK